MNARWLVVVGLLSLGVLGGCAEVIDDPALSEAAARGGCRWDCPPCQPNHVCSLAPCILQCPPGHTPCGPTACTNGDVCCNDSCGICTEPGGFCIDLYCEAPERGHTCDVRALCIEGYSWSEALCRCVPDHGNPHVCASDADCTTLSSYCDGCTCEAATTAESAPNCPAGHEVACFVDPCFNQTSYCDAGTGECVLTPLDTTWVDPATAL
jgi:hypothetical protein